MPCDVKNDDDQADDGGREQRDYREIEELCGRLNCMTNKDLHRMRICKQQAHVFSALPKSTQRSHVPFQKLHRLKSLLGATVLGCPRPAAPASRIPARMPLEAGKSDRGCKFNRIIELDWRGLSQLSWIKWSSRSWVVGEAPFAF
ncbi:hypothetical protein OJAV_G00228550 [Oryzias javanicus]|uniref:Uncharacterized protein n=1 Tax=Oryzias javanicus TaxID=123683 RepID=A0A3S2TUM9_ORYJA|nr:hypothetical protein OJAV_G00228550 [Oryzias javanicus]